MSRAIPLIALLIAVGFVPSFVGANPDLVAYESSFDAGGGPEWSDATGDVTPSGRPFLGQFGTGSVTLSLADLPGHTGVRVEFDVFIIRSWDGAGNFCCGPDVFDVRVAGEAPLLRTTFSNTGPSNGQNYPGSVGGEVYPARTGAAERNTLGYMSDSVYRIELAFPHTSDLALAFSAENLQGIRDESWGLDNVRVTLTGVDTEAPSVAITSPSEHVTVGDLAASAPVDPGLRVVAGTVTVKADAADGGSGVASVAFLVDGNLRAMDTEAPFEFAWAAGADGAGEHTVTAVATDLAGNAAEASAVFTAIPA